MRDVLYALAISYLRDLLGRRAGAGASLLALQRLSPDGLASGIFALGIWLGGYDVAAVMGAAVIALAMLEILRLDRRMP